MVLIIKCSKNVKLNLIPSKTFYHNEHKKLKIVSLKNINSSHPGIFFVIFPLTKYWSDYAKIINEQKPEAEC